MSDNSTTFDDIPDQKLDSNVNALGLLDFLKTENGKKYLKYRFFREPYWLGYTSILSVTFYAVLAIGISFTPIPWLAIPIVAFLFYKIIGGDSFLKKIIFPKICSQVTYSVPIDHLSHRQFVCG